VKEGGAGCSDDHFNEATPFPPGLKLPAAT
jgi:hypothetical protein